MVKAVDDQQGPPSCLRELLGRRREQVAEPQAQLAEVSFGQAVPDCPAGAFQLHDEVVEEIGG